jgi:putative tricarboxylic transport membrane protein
VPTGMRRGWQITAIVMFTICLITLWEARNLSLFDRLGPGSGFFPFYLALIGAAMSGLILFQVTRASGPDRSETTLFPRGITAWRAIAILVCSVFAASLLELLGFRLTITLFSAALLPALGETRWWAIALFAMTAGFGIFHLFNDWLDVLLPIGVFGI